MPSCSDALRDLMRKWFNRDGDCVDEWKVIQFLMSHGFTETNGMIKPPVPAHNMSTIEWFCIRYLVEEWDYDFLGTIDTTIKE